jgi:HPt (histidine-containing phosphotransfer) domain-containing protein
MRPWQPQMTDHASKEDATRRALDALRDRYRASVATTLDLFGSIASQLTAAPDAGDTLATLVRELHRVRGTSGSFGFAEASRLAGALEVRAKQWAADPACERLARGDAVRAFTAALRDALA